MSSEELFLRTLLEAARAVGLEVLVVGSTAAVLQGAPLMTQDVDILVRDTAANRDKVNRFAERLGAAIIRPSELSTTVKLVDVDVPIDVLFDKLPTGERFESLRSRSRQVPVGNLMAAVIALEDVIASKKAADRDKDRAQLPTLERTLRVLEKLESSD